MKATLRPMVGAAALALALSAASAASADVYELNLDNGSTHLIDTTPYSTVTVTQNGANDLRFVVQLASDLFFQESTAHDAFAFSLNGFSFLSVTLSNFSSTLFSADPNTPVGQDGFGNYEFGVQYTGPNPGNTSKTSDVQTLSFDATATGLTLAPGLFASSTNPPGSLSTFFSADVFDRTLGLEGLSATGVIGGSATTTQTLAVPEASTWGMLLVGFAGLGFTAFRRRKGNISIV
jgi:hypothetical protein